MAKRYEVTSADGRKRIVDGDSGEILPDGATLRVPLMMRDSALSPMQKAIADAATFDADKARRDFDALCRHAYEVKERAYLDFKASLADAWKSPPAPATEIDDRRRKRKGTSRDPLGRETGSWEEIEEEDAVPGGQKPGDACTINGAPGRLNARLQCVPDRQDARSMTADEARPIRDAAYAEYCRSLEDAWRTRP